MSATANQNARKLHRICAMPQAARLVELAKVFAKVHGYSGASGSGWIHDAAGNAVEQGWMNFASKFRTKMLDWVCASGTAFASFDAMLNALGGYRPTLRPDADWRFLVLAVEYDCAQERRDDERRAFMMGFAFRANGTCDWDGSFPSPQGWQRMAAGGKLLDREAA